MYSYTLGLLLRDCFLAQCGRQLEQRANYCKHAFFVSFHDSPRTSKKMRGQCGAPVALL